MHLQSLLETILGPAHGLSRHGAETVARTLRGINLLEPHPRDQDAIDQGEALLGTAAQFNSLSSTLRLAARELSVRGQQFIENLPITTVLDETDDARVLLVGRTAPRVEVFLAETGTNLADFLATRFEAEINQRATEELPELPIEHWLAMLTAEKSPALAMSKLARQVIFKEGFAFKRQDLEARIAKTLRNLRLDRAIAPTWLRRSERVAAMFPVGSTLKTRRSGSFQSLQRHVARGFGPKSTGASGPILPQKNPQRLALCRSQFWRGPTLNTIGVKADAATFPETLSQAYFSRGDILVLNRRAA